jgi:AcrR family transcriptional regulator
MLATVTGRERAWYVARPTRGDERRVRLLAALRQLLEVRPLAEIGVAEISRAAGVTRSAFYFYFPTKAAAVAALLADLREDILEAGAAWYGRPDRGPLQRVRDTVDASLRLWREHASLMVAMLDAAGQDSEVRQAWQSWTQEFIDQITTRIAEDREQGLIRSATDPHALATVLMGATLYGMERDVRATASGQAATEDLPAALVELWYRTLYA